MAEYWIFVRRPGQERERIGPFPNSALRDQRIRELIASGVEPGAITKQDRLRRLDYENPTFGEPAEFDYPEE
jgi:hypothetical protein